MLSEAGQERAQIFWKAFKIWGGIMAIPGAAATLMSAPEVFKSAFAPAYPAHFVYGWSVVCFYYVFVPAAAFGGLGAAALTFLVRPGQKFRAVVVGTVTGLGCPAAFFAALALILPKNEATLGWVFGGIIYGGIGIFAGVVAGNTIASYPAPSR
jgi:hypothetical protein